MAYKIKISYVNSSLYPVDFTVLFSCSAISVTNCQKAQRTVRQTPWKSLHLLASRRNVSIYEALTAKTANYPYLRIFLSYSVCSHEAPIKYFSLRKKNSQNLGTIYVETRIESRFSSSNNDDSTVLASPGYSEGLDKLGSEITHGPSVTKPMYKVM